MERETTATFIGHRECIALERFRIESGIQQMISGGVTDFLCGGMGDFDRICAGIVYHLKPTYQQIQCHLVIGYQVGFQIRESLEQLSHPAYTLNFFHNQIKRFTLASSARLM